MNIDVNALRSAISNDINNGGKKNFENDNPYKLLYPFEEGRYVVRIFYNPKGKTVQKKILRHATNDNKVKVPCLSVYGEECPVCSAVKEAEEIVGKDVGVFRKYGYSTRGICYAQLIEAPEKVIADGNVKPGDIILFMYPKTVFAEINNILIESGEQLEDVISKNNGYTIIVKTIKKGTKKEYSTQLSVAKATVCESDEAFENLLNELPNITEQFVPEYPNDEIRQSAKALADTIRAEYLNTSVVDPNSPPKPVVNEVKSKNSLDIIVEDDELPFVVDEPIEHIITNANDEVIATETIAPTPNVNADGSPDCFGCYKNGERKCMLCIKEIDCMKASK